MTVLFITYLAGLLTILSPCILPVLPFVFARTGQPFVKSTLPMLAGMAITFAGVATLAAVGGSWAVHANEYGRYAAIALLAIFGATLLSPQDSHHTHAAGRCLREQDSQCKWPIVRPDFRKRASAWCCNRSSLGSLCWTDPRSGADGRRSPGRER